LLIVLASALVVVLLGARVYENALLRTGGRVKLGEAIRG
jgi:ABC-2 type transport system permease protein